MTWDEARERLRGLAGADRACVAGAMELCALRERRGLPPPSGVACCALSGRVVLEWQDDEGFEEAEVHSRTGYESTRVRYVVPVGGD